MRPFWTQDFAHNFGTSCQPSGHHFMDHGSVLCAHFRHNILRTFLVHHANHLGTISWTQWTPSLSLPFPSPPPRTPPCPPTLDLSSPVVCSLAYHWAGSLSEWQHASSSELPLLGPRKETVDSTIQARSTDRALQCQLVCVSRRKNKHNAKSLDKQKF